MAEPHQSLSKPGSSQSNIPIKTIKLHRVQSEFRHSDALYRGFVGGRGSGKSYVGAYDLIFRAMSERGRGRLYMVVAPTYVILQDASMRTVVQIAEELGVIKERWKQPPRLVLNNGSEIIFRSGDDPEKLRGPNLSGVWMDEASLMSKEA